jgi:hypothetical protein
MPDHNSHLRNSECNERVSAARKKGECSSHWQARLIIPAPGMIFVNSTRVIAFANDMPWGYICGPDGFKYRHKHP